MSAKDRPKQRAGLKVLAVLVSILCCLAVLVAVWLLESSNLSPAEKVGIFALAALSWPVVSAFYRTLLMQLGLASERARELLDAMAKAKLPKAEKHHADIESFLSEIQECEHLPPRTRMTAAQWSLVVVRGRAEHTFANIESEALDLAFADYARLGIGTDHALRVDED
ncbi:MAG: hypothetical protein JNL19_08515 [Burkholderiales bacterium]|nr:hypothetical protein [Burkholderiales bacterium]